MQKTAPSAQSEPDDSRRRGARDDAAEISRPAVRHARAGRSRHAAAHPRCACRLGQAGRARARDAGATRAARCSRTRSCARRLRPTSSTSSTPTSTWPLRSAPRCRERAKPLAAPAAAGLQDQAARFAERALARPRVQQAWRAANEEADRRLIAFIEDDSGALRTTSGNVTLDLRQILQQVEGRAGLADRIDARLPPNAGQIVLLRSNELSLAQQGVRALKAVANFIVIIVLLIFAARHLDRARSPPGGARVRDRIARGRPRAHLHSPRGGRPADRSAW